jgi:AraC-like DNA-binding protein
VLYREYRPDARLDGVVVCTWERVVPQGADAPSGRILPDGCFDLIWRSGSLMVAGPDTAAVVSHLEPGEVISGIRFAPGTAEAVLGMPAAEVRDRRVEVGEIWGADAGEVIERLAKAVAGERRRELERTVLTRLARVGSAGDALVAAAVRRLGGPGSRVSTLADSIGLSERQLRRRFHVAVGYGPKTLDRVLRLQRFLAHAPALARGDADLARVAFELGYADQAHLTREAVSLAGLTPTKLAAERAG